MIQMRRWEYFLMLDFVCEHREPELSSFVAAHLFLHHIVSDSVVQSEHWYLVVLSQLGHLQEK